MTVPARLTRVFLPAALLLMTAAALPACRGTSPSGHKYSLQPNREIEARFTADHKAVHAAGLEAMRALEYRVRWEQTDAFEGSIEAKTANDNTVTVQTYAGKNGTETRCQIWVGPLGDVERAGEVLDLIEQGLQ